MNLSGFILYYTFVVYIIIALFSIFVVINRSLQLKKENSTSKILTILFMIGMSFIVIIAWPMIVTQQFINDMKGDT